MMARRMMFCTVIGAWVSSACGSGPSAWIPDDGSPDAPSAPDAPPPPTDVPVRIYAHNSNTLFRLDPTTFEVMEVGPMTGCSGVVDIAVNGDNQIFGSGSADNQGTGVLSIDADTGACSLAVSGGFANALSFVPKGVLHPDKEMLVSYGLVDGVSQYVSIDPDTGVVTGIGPVPEGYGSSGDIVSVEGGGTYWSAYGPCMDCLVELNPQTGAIIRDWGSLGYGGVWGLAYWGGVVYGFTSQGEVFRVSFANDTISTTLVDTAGVSFYGAGSTTNAPIVVN